MSSCFIRNWDPRVFFSTSSSTFLTIWKMRTLFFFLNWDPFMFLYFSSCRGYSKQVINRLCLFLLPMVLSYTKQTTYIYKREKKNLLWRDAAMLQIKYCRTGNIRMQEMFTNFRNFHGFFLHVIITIIQYWSHIKAGNPPPKQKFVEFSCRETACLPNSRIFHVANFSCITVIFYKVLLP